jgi:hypothetical protein
VSNAVSDARADSSASRRRCVAELPSALGSLDWRCRNSKGSEEKICWLSLLAALFAASLRWPSLPTKQEGNKTDEQKQHTDSSEQQTAQREKQQLGAQPSNKASSSDE